MKLKQQYAWAVGTTFAASGAFYLWQNDWATAGGHIALPKALWLGLTIFYWLILTWSLKLEMMEFMLL